MSLAVDGAAPLGSTSRQRASREYKQQVALERPTFMKGQVNMKNIKVCLVMTGLSLSMASPARAEQRYYQAVSSCVWNSNGSPTQFGVENISSTVSMAVFCSTDLLDQNVRINSVTVSFWDRNRTSQFACFLSGTDQYGNNVAWSQNPLEDTITNGRYAANSFTFSPPSVPVQMLFLQCDVPPFDSVFGNSYFSSFLVNDTGE